MQAVFSQCRECRQSFWYEDTRDNGGRKRSVCDKCAVERKRRKTRERVRRFRDAHPRTPVLSPRSRRTIPIYTRIEGSTYYVTFLSRRRK